MEITWYGHSCFRLFEKGMAVVVTDPYDAKDTGYSSLQLKADIVTISQNVPGHNHLAAINGSPFTITGAGEYEIGGVFITGVQTSTHGRLDELPRNTLYLFDYNGMNIVHFGNLDRVPTQSEVEGLGPVHVALVPVGGADSLNASKAVEVISLLEPKIVIPMRYELPGCIMKLDPLGKFLKEMGLTEIETLPSLKISDGALPEETRVVILDHQRN